MSTESGGAGDEEGRESTIVEGSESALDVTMMFGVSVATSCDDERVGNCGSFSGLVST